MAVNLRATATLNAGPYLKTLNTISSATTKLNTSAVKGNEKVTDGVLKQTAAREAAARAARSTAVATEAGNTRASRTLRQATVDAQAYNKALNETRLQSARIVDAYANMTPAVARHQRAMAGLTRSQVELARQVGSGLTGPALVPYQQAVDKAAQSVGRARAAIVEDNEKIAKSAGRAAKAQVGLAVAGNAAATGLAAQRYMFHDLSRQMIMYTALAAAFPAASIGIAASWEKTFADVKRTADPAFSTVEYRVESLRDSLISMAQTMPTAFKDIAEIATLANQMGIASTQTAEFSRAVAMFAATSGVSVDMVATAFGRLTSIMGDSRIGFMEMADSVLKVGVNSVATEAEIINITAQISSIAQQAGMTAKDIIGLSGAMASVRVPPELSRGVITRVFGQIDKAVNAGSTGLQTLARISGVSADQFRKDWGTDASAGLFNAFLHGLRDAGSAARSELNSLGITSVRDVPVMLRIANAADSEGNVGELLTQTMRDANNAAGETQRQYVIMANTVVGKLKILGNNVMAFFDAAGRTSLGIFGDILDNMIKGIRDFTNNMDKLSPLLGIFGATNADVLGFAIALGAGVSALTLMGSALSKVFASIATFRHTGPAIAAMFGGKTLANTSAIAATTGAAAAGATRFGGAIATIGRFINPWTAGLALGAATIGVLNSQMARGVTNAEDLATSLSKVNTASVDDINRMLGNITTKGLWNNWSSEMNANPFTGGLEVFRADVATMVENVDRNLKNFGGWKGMANLGAALDGFGMGLRSSKEGVKILDEAISSMVGSGNSAQAINTVRQLATSGKDLADMLRLDEFSGTNRFLENAFNLSDIKMTQDNLDRLVKGTLPELTDAMLGVKGASLNAAELFEGDFDRLGQFAQAFDEAAAAFINFEDSVKSGTLTDKDGNVTGFDLSAWRKSMDEQVTAQKDWYSNLSEIMKHGSTEVLEELASLGPEGALATKALAEGLAAGEPEAIAALESLEAAVAAKVELVGNSIADELANIDWLRGIAKDDNVFNKILEAFTVDDVSRLRAASDGVSQQVVAGIVDGIASSKDPAKAFVEAFRSLELAKPMVTISAEFEDSAITRGLAGVEARIKKLKPGIDVKINKDTTVADLRKIMDDPYLNTLEVNTELSLTDAYAKSREFQVWAAEKEIDMFLGLNDHPAQATLATMVALGNGSVSHMQLSAVTSLAEDALWDVVTLADGTTAFVQVEADNTLAMDSVFQVDAKTGEVQTIPIDGDAKGAINESLKARTNTEKPATMPILGDAAKLRGTISLYDGKVVGTSYIELIAKNSVVLPHADGGISYYANGGVRESHVAQIAPAGAMRVWAEPETGGEAYIPLAESKRLRSLSILDDVAARFGYSLTPQTYTYADGGQYNAQLMSRSRYVSSPVRNAKDAARLQIGEVNFNNESEKEQFRELKRTLDRFSRGAQ